MLGVRGRLSCRQGGQPVSLICYATRIHFADGVLEDALTEELRRAGATAALVLVDAEGEAGHAPQRLADVWPETVLQLRRAVGPSGPGADHLAETFLASGAEAIIAFGGARALNLARLVKALVDGRRAALLAVPTTPGAVGLGPLGGAPAPLPDVILCDPTLLAGPATPVLAASGMAALTGCLEVLLGSAWNPPADGIAFDGLRRAGQWLPVALADRREPEARRQILAAGLNAGLAAQKGYGALHALASALERGVASTQPHGWLRGALAGPVLAFNAPASASRLDLVAQALNLPPQAAGDAGGALAEAVTSLARQSGLPTDLGGLDLAEDDLDRVAADAAEDSANRTNPRHATRRDYRQMLEAAMPAAPDRRPRRAVR